MFIAIYTYIIKEGQEESFIEAWKGLTELIIKHEDSLGSRLHHEGGQKYLAYAQWRSKEQWKSFGGNLPEVAKELSAKLNAACEEFITAHELNIVDDLLISAM